MPGCAKRSCVAQEAVKRTSWTSEEGALVFSVGWLQEASVCRLAYIHSRASSARVSATEDTTLSGKDACAPLRFTM